ncbi:MAG: TIGR04255 family protein [Planctomycetes bacterium]|nr:TIGR04255 family protein [Planctomycetota bacterium]MBI3835939.1 TIGR04255 family protein [Planctomycetota bacterium]
MSNLPWFDHPPIVETVLGVQFEPPTGLTNSHLSLYWSQVRNEWATATDAPRLEPQFEVFSSEQMWAAVGPTLMLTNDPSRRLQLRNRENSRMVQLQNSRFHYNWLDTPDTKYPRYEECIKPEFKREWTRFREFLHSEGLGEPKINQWEVTYVNHIPRSGRVPWHSPEEWASILPGLLGRTQEYAEAARFESFGGQWHFEIPLQRGRLHVQLIHGKPGDENAPEILRMDLTARGPVPDAPDPLSSGLDLGRETIVRMFVALTSPEAHKAWGIHYA